MSGIIFFAVVMGLITKLTLGSWLIGLIGTPVFIFCLGFGIAIHKEFHPERYTRERKPARPTQKDDVPTIDEIAFWDACLGDD